MRQWAVGGVLEAVRSSNFSLPQGEGCLVLGAWFVVRGQYTHGLSVGVPTLVGSVARPLTSYSPLPSPLSMPFRLLLSFVLLVVLPALVVKQAVAWRAALGAPVIYVTSDADHFRHDRLAWEAEETTE